MDSRSFDRLARLLGGATDRRAGLKAALGALVTGGLAADAAATNTRKEKDKDKQKGKGRDLRGKDNDRNDADGGAGVDDAKKKKVCRAVGATCKKAKNCCSGFCLKSTAMKKRKGVCQCLPEGETCSAEGSCCAGFVCVDGRCQRREIPTGQACEFGDVCEDPAAACIFYDPTERSVRKERNRRDRQPRSVATRICLLGGGSECAKNEVCASLNCVDNVCTGPRFVPLGDRCVPGQDRCADSRARCGGYASGSGGPAGDYCLLPNGEVCDVDLECRNNDCAAGFCGRKPVDTGAACDPQRDTCRNGAAVCTRYANGADPQTYCLLENGAICDAANECISDECLDGTCGGVVPIPTGGECEAGSVCAAADATCTVYANLPDQTTRCLVRTGGACGESADCVSLACERGICVELQPGVCDVCADGCPHTTIAAAIEAGLTDIEIQGGATYTEHDLPVGNRTLTLRSCRNTGQATIDAGRNGRVMIVEDGGNVSLIDLRVRNGQIDDGNGGCFLVNPGGKLSLVDSDIETCEVLKNADPNVYNTGGAVAVLAGEFEMLGGAMRGNVADDDGGALHLRGAIVRLSGVTFENNRSGYYGGAIYSNDHWEFDQEPTLDIEECVFRQNQSEYSAGAVYVDHLVTVRTSQFTGNVAGGDGGGLKLDCSAIGSTISNCTFTGNTGYSGGGFYSDASEASLTNSTFSGNRAEFSGGGVYNSSGLAMLNVQVTNNTADQQGGGIYNDGELAMLGNTQVNGNNAPEGGGVYNWRADWDPEYGGTVYCGSLPPAPDVCGNTADNCVGMDEQGTCVALEVCKPGACG